jgi:hypothetical protein
MAHSIPAEEIATPRHQTSSNPATRRSPTARHSDADQLRCPVWAERAAPYSVPELTPRVNSRVSTSSAMFCKFVGVRLPRFESLTRHAAQTAHEQHRQGRGPIFVTSGAVRPYSAVYGYSRPIPAPALRRTDGRHAVLLPILHAGTRGIPSIWRSPTTRCPGGNMSLNYRPSARLAPGAARGSPWGDRRDATSNPIPYLVWV